MKCSLQGSPLEGSPFPSFYRYFFIKSTGNTKIEKKESYCYLQPDLTSFVLSPQASQLVAMIITSLKWGIADLKVKARNFWHV